MKKQIHKRTDRLEILISAIINVNWAERFPGNQGWEVIHGTTGGGKNCLILDMKENGYSVFIQADHPVRETVDQEISRLSLKTNT